MPLIPSEEIRELKASIDLRVIAGRYTQLRGKREMFGSCPRCGGLDRFHVQSDKFFCRECYPPEVHHGRHDVFDFLIFVGVAVDFLSAVEYLLQEKDKAPLSPVRQIESKDLKPRYQNEDWQTTASRFTDRAKELLYSEHGAKGRLYLQSRGLSLDTCEEHDLGLASVKNSAGYFSWAITIPWFDGDFVTAIQYRYLEPANRQRYGRFSAWRHYGDTIVYHTVPKDSSDLVIVEGEFNALSIWQGTDFDCVSVGSQNFSGRTLNRLVELSKSYERIFLWFDDTNASRGVLEHLGRGFIIEQTEDANSLLQGGVDLEEVFKNG